MSMTTSKIQGVPFELRFRTMAPHPDESLSSAIDRVAGLWSVGRIELLRQLGYTKGSKELDTLVSLPLLESMARAFGTDAEYLVSLAVPRDRSGTLVSSGLRYAYCPLCMEEDWRSGYTPYFRLDWGRLWVTHCRRHLTPLFEWGKMSYSGQRLLPHELHLSYEPSASLPGWMSSHLAEAKLWAGRAGSDDGDHALWKALIKVEEAWCLDGTGDPRRDATAIMLRRERILVKLAVLFLASSDPARTCLAGRLHIPPHQHSVLGYDARRQRRGFRNPTWCEFGTILTAIQARRAVTLLVAHTLGLLGTALRYATGAVIPPGRSVEWASEIAAQRADRRLVLAALRIMDDW
ncbi:TniQ family protein [Dyella sp. ASV21]|uniref:TniQ family protein n=1 Tax=Dyella sp. ASV21 TaxID=2795114 RepID=UPI0018EC85DD|nr:TniQ family protein [Dyella sp. ASV21]